MKRSIEILLSLFIIITFVSCSAEVPRIDKEQLVRDLRFISSDSTMGRKTGTVGNRIARDYIIERFRQSGAKPFEGSYEHPFEFTNWSDSTLTGVNVLSYIKGETDSLIVISAHHDHLGTRDSLIYNGADDNASGTAALLSMADYFGNNKPVHTMIFAAFDAEEMGFSGAKSLVSDSMITRMTVLNVNMDMIAQNDSDEIYAAGTYHYPHLKEPLVWLSAGSPKLLFGHDQPGSRSDDWTNASDHSPFHEAGIPFVYFGVENHKYYHRATDEFETVPLDFYTSAADLILRAVIALDKL